MSAKRKMAAVEGGICHCTSLRKASRRISQMYDIALAPSGLKNTQRAILSQIRLGGAMTISALAEALVMDAGGRAHTLKPLDRDGLVEIGVDPDDRRGRVVSLSPAGLAKLKEAEALWNAAQHGFENAFGHAQSALLLKAVNQLTSDQFLVAFERALEEKGTSRHR